MKKVMKMKKLRLLPVLCTSTVIAIILNMFSLCAFAQSDEMPFVTDDFYEFEGVGDVNDVGRYPSFFNVNGAAFTGLYYDQLDDGSKDVYDSMYEQYGTSAHSKAVSVSANKIFHNVTVTVKYGTCYLDDASKNTVYQWLQDTVSPAMASLVYDRPELSWLINARYGVGYTIASVSIPAGVTQKVMDITVTGIRYQLQDVFTDTGNINDINNAVAEAKTVIDGSLDEAEGTYGTVKAIHDYICSTVTYTQTNLSARLYQTPYSALCGAKNTVCAGYSKAFKLICNAYGIPCILVSGTGVTASDSGAHMWNYVNLGGAWYGIDTTWDDQSVIRYDCFLAGYSTTMTHFGNKTFGESHLQSGNLVGTYVFNYPALSQTEHIHLYDFSDLENGTHCGICLCGKTVTEEHTWNEGVVTVKPTYRTEGEITFTCTNCTAVSFETVDRKAIIKGDINLDGRLNSKDVLDMKKYFAALITIDEYQKIAANVNGDRVINSRDLQALKMILAAE